MGRLIRIALHQNCACLRRRAGDIAVLFSDVRDMTTFVSSVVPLRMRFTATGFHAKMPPAVAPGSGCRVVTTIRDKREAARALKATGLKAHELKREAHPAARGLSALGTLAAATLLTTSFAA